MLKYTIETLYHYSCGMCKRWFTIADKGPESQFMVCPHCAERQEVIYEPVKPVPELEKKVHNVTCTCGGSVFRLYYSRNLATCHACLKNYKLEDVVGNVKIEHTR